MVSGNSRNNRVFFLNSLLFKVIIIIISISFSLNIVDGLITRLNNGNFSAFTSEGTYTVDPIFTYYLATDSSYTYNRAHDNLAHFSEEDDGYIIFISLYHYIFSSDGTIFRTSGYSSQKNYYEYSIIPYTHDGDTYYYFYVYNNNNDFFFAKYEFNKKQPKYTKTL